jgi:4-alpha-glucanotransferase
MSDSSVVALAEAAGLLIDWEDAAGISRRVSIDSLRAILSGLGFDCANKAQCMASLARLHGGVADSYRLMDAGTSLTGMAGRARLHLEDGTARDLDLDARPAIDIIGYHVLEQANGDTLPLIVTPTRCAALAAGERRWGLAVQVYSLSGPQAFGDFAALANFTRNAAHAGADVLMLSPVHALFTSDPTRYSPYSPSSRDFLNPWYADPGQSLGHSAGQGLIDWPEAVKTRLASLRRAFETQRNAASFTAYEDAASLPLRQHCLFEALHAHFFARTHARCWQDWPAAYHRPDMPAVAQFAADHAEDLRFHLFLQYLAETGLEEARRESLDMRIGLVSDIAVGLDAGGSHAWSRGNELMMGIGIGAPPDAFQAAGQNWGITSFSPVALRAAAYRPFITLLRSAMRYAGGIRIDHALGLRRLWVVPNGASPLDGAYLRQPEADLLRIVALESTRAGALVIGEDLGVVPRGLRATLAGHGLLGMRVLPFERTRDGAFKAAELWDEAAVAMTSTHDLPPVAGWWSGRDISWREALGAAGDRELERADREVDRVSLWETTGRAGAPPPADQPVLAVDASIAIVAKTPCALAIIPIEDLLGLDEAPNLPGTIDEHPNWRRRLQAPAEVLLAQPDVVQRLARLREERPA